MLIYTPYIVVNREGMPPSHFCAHSFFNCPFCGIVLYLCYIPMNSYPSNDYVPMVLHTAVFSRPPELYNCTLLINRHAH